MKVFAWKVIDTNRTFAVEVTDDFGFDSAKIELEKMVFPDVLSDPVVIEGDYLDIVEELKKHSPYTWVQF